MKKISQYFLGSCIAFTIANIITIIIHLIDKKNTINVNSEIFLIVIIILINIILYFMEDLQIESQVIHVTLEFIITILISFMVGIPTKVIVATSIYGICENIFIIALIYVITILSLYIYTQKDAQDINKKLSVK